MTHDIRFHRAALLAAVLIAGCSAGAPGRSSPGPEDAGAAPLDVDASPQIDAARPSEAPRERCGDGTDDDLDGNVDEGCGCVAGEVRRCYPFDRALAGIGACAWGAQRCEAGLDLPAWGACEGAVAPAEEVCGGGDEDCDGTIDEGCCGAACPCPAPSAETARNDDCSTATPITAFGTYHGTVRGASDRVTVPAPDGCRAPLGSPEVVYRVDVPGRIHVSVCGGFVVYGASSCGGAGACGAGWSWGEGPVYVVVEPYVGTTATDFWLRVEPYGS